MFSRQTVTLPQEAIVSSTRWHFRQKREGLGDLTHTLRPTLTEQQPRSNVDVLRSVEEPEDDDGLLIGLNAALSNHRHNTNFLPNNAQNVHILCTPVQAAKCTKKVARAGSGNFPTHTANFQQRRL